MLLYLVLLIAAAALAAFLTKVVRDLANRLGLAFAPTSGRHIHAVPTPRLGGIAIVFTFLIVSLLYWVGMRFGWIHQSHNLTLVNIVVPALGLFIVGLIDDLRGLSARIKLAAQIGGGAYLYFAGLRLVCLHSLTGNSFLTSAVCFSLTVGCVVLICNAINLIDGLDGLAAGAALFSMATIFTVAMVNGRHGTALAVTILAGANLGFLVFNFNPASIFLGDSGSLFVGFMLSGLVMSESTHQTDPLRSVMIPLVALALPLTDLLITVLRRYLSGHSLFGADREHIHHKLLELGMSQRQVVCVLYAFSAFCAVLSLAFLDPSRLLAVPAVAIVLLVVFFGVRKLKYEEFSELERFATRLRQQKQVATSNIALRKAAARLEDTATAADIVSVLEQHLKSDFDGFRILLDRGHWVTCDFDDVPSRVLEKSWATTRHDRLTLSMDLSTERFGKVGRIILEHSSGRRLLVDSNLLQRELRHALGIALEHCIIAMPPDFSTDDDTQAMAQGA
jgi:UDP-GlcNAc:undecaprenyl-phosphate GlcNAc-1-phosphate transferase